MSKRLIASNWRYLKLSTVISFNHALRKGLMNYDVRHGFRGPEMNIPVPVDEAALKAALHGIPRVGGLAAAVVTRVDQKSVLAYTLAHGQVEIAWEGLSWARRYINEDSRGAAPKSASDLLAAGDVIRVAEDGNSGWALSQIPDVEGALVAMDPDNGAIRALAGGFDFFRSKFNRVTQAERQPGSNFKPFVYAAAMDKGFTPASIINDAPVVFADAGTEGVWRPENYSGKFFGPTRLREALYHSRNLVSVRLMSAIGVPYTVDYLQRFGFSPRRLPPNLTLALGTATLTPLEMARGFGVFANGGYLVDPHIVAKVTTSDGSVVFEAKPKTVCRECEQARAPALMPVTAHAPVATVQPLPQLVETAPLDRLEIEPAPRVIPEQTAWLMTSMLRDVVKLGTGRRALSLQRNDLGGKTGTTNDQKDVWFSGYNASLVATVWMGFDQLRELGGRETGSSAALPVWIDFMDVALRDVPERVLPQPSGLVTVRIDPETGDLAAAGSPGAILETFPADRVPTRVADGGMGLTSAPAIGASADSAGVPQQLF